MGNTLYGCVKFTDFIGDYFLMKIAERAPILRLEEDHHGYSVGRLEVEYIELYKWFNTTIDPAPGAGV